jgi:hypothetical protein
VLGGYLREAYQEAETFSLLLQQRVKGAGFFKTLLLRRLGSSMEAGRRTVSKLLGGEPDILDDDEEDDTEEEALTPVGQGPSDFKNFTDAERTSLERCLKLLKEGGNNDPKLEALIGFLRGTNPRATRSWFDLGCILFSQYYDTVRWIGDEMAKRAEFAGVDIGLYAGSNRSGFWREGKFQRSDRNILKEQVRTGDLKLLLGTEPPPRASTSSDWVRSSILTYLGIQHDLSSARAAFKELAKLAMKSGSPTCDTVVRWKTGYIRCWQTDWNQYINYLAKSPTL